MITLASNIAVGNGRIAPGISSGKPQTTKPEPYLFPWLRLGACFLGCLASDIAQAQTPTLSPANREVSTLIKLFESVHFNRAEVPSSRFPEVIVDFMAALDDERIFFFESDRISLVQSLGATLYSELAVRGSTAAAEKITSVYRQRLRERVAWLEAELAPTISFTDDESHRLSRDIDYWPVDSKAADAIWRRRVKSELLAEVMNDVPIEQAKDVVRRRYAQLVALADGANAEKRREQFLHVVTGLFDSRSEYYNADTFAEFGLTLNAVTVGLQVERIGGRIYVEQLDLGGPAQRSGAIGVGDRVVALIEGDGVPFDVVGQSAGTINHRLRGPRGSMVHLILEPVLRADAAERKRVSLQRGDGAESVRVRAAVAQVPSGSAVAPIGVVQVPAFYGEIENSEPAKRTTSTEDTKRLVGLLEARGVVGIVLDLRGNGGGYLTESIATAGLFLGRKTVAHIRKHDGTVSRETGGSQEPFYSGPLVVLVDKITASGAEIVAGALQAHGRAVIVGGKRTNGDGTVQQVLEIKQLSRVLSADSARTGAAKLTIQKFYLPSGASTQLRGIVPDILIPSLLDDIVRGQDSDRRALPWDEMKVVWQKPPVIAGLAQSVRERSEARQREGREFAWLKEMVELQHRVQTEEISLNLATRQRQKAAVSQHLTNLRARAVAMANDALKIHWIEAQTGQTTGNPESLSHFVEQTGVVLDVALQESLRVAGDLTSK